MHRVWLGIQPEQVLSHVHVVHLEELQTPCLKLVGLVCLWQEEPGLDRNKQNT